MLLVAASVVVRLWVMPEFIHGFRQTQTAESVYWMVHGTGSLYNYETPILGPPWQVPMEFPTHQAFAAVLVRLGLGAGPACRYTSLAFFYVTGALLYLVIRRVFRDRLVAIWTVLTYLWLPYNIDLGNSGLIESCALAFIFAYLYCFMRWLDRRSAAWLVACIACGIVGGLTKVTSIAVMIPPFAYLAVSALREGYARRSQPDPAAAGNAPHRGVRGLWLGLAVILVIPLVLVYGWTLHSDAVKEANPFARFLTSTNLREWNLGYPGQKLSAANWLAWLKIWRTLLLPGLFPVLAVGVLAGIRKCTARETLFLLSTIAGCFCAVAIFFNLYRHEYYYASLAPFTALVAGFGAAGLCRLIPWGGGWVVTLALWLTAGINWPALNQPKLFSDRLSGVRAAGAAVERVTPAGDWVVADQPDWNSDLLFYAHRRGLIASGPSLTYGGGEALFPAIKNPRYTTLVTTDRNSRLFDAWSSHRMVYSNLAARLFVYKVGPAPTSTKRRLLLDSSATLRADGGTPYGETSIPVAGTFEAALTYRMAVHFRTEGNSKPFLILISSDSEMVDLPVHDQLWNTSSGSYEFQFCIPYAHDIHNPVLLVRNWSGQGSVIALENFRKTEITFFNSYSYLSHQV